MLCVKLEWIFELYDARLKWLCVFDIDGGIWYGYVSGAFDMFLYGIGISWIIGLKKICDSLALDSTGQRKYAKRGLRGKVKMQRGAFVERSNNEKGPSGRIQWKSRADTRLDLSQNNKKNGEAYAYEY